MPMHVDYSPHLLHGILTRHGRTATIKETNGGVNVSGCYLEQRGERNFFGVKTYHCAPKDLVMGLAKKAMGLLSMVS